MQPDARSFRDRDSGEKVGLCNRKVEGRGSFLHPGLALDPMDVNDITEDVTAFCYQCRRTIPLGSWWPGCSVREVKELVSKQSVKESCSVEVQEDGPSYCWLGAWVYQFWTNLLKNQTWTVRGWADLDLEVRTLCFRVLKDRVWVFRDVPSWLLFDCGHDFGNWELLVVHRTGSVLLQEEGALGHGADSDIGLQLASPVWDRLYGVEGLVVVFAVLCYRGEILTHCCAQLRGATCIIHGATCDRGI